MSVYIDSSAFYAVVDKSDAKHTSAARTWDQLLDDEEILLTSSYVVTESIALLHSRLGTDVVGRFVADILPVVSVEWIDEETHAAALSAMLATPGKRGPSLTDCANLELMRRRGVSRIFAYDGHFENLGLTVMG